jgi:hypothetical protein
MTIRATFLPALTHRTGMAAIKIAEYMEIRGVRVEIREFSFFIGISVSRNLTCLVIA